MLRGLISKTNWLFYKHKAPFSLLFLFNTGLRQHKCITSSPFSGLFVLHAQYPLKRKKNGQDHVNYAL